MQFRVEGANNAGLRPISVRCPACRQIGVFETFTQNDWTVPPTNVTVGERRCPNPECRTHLFVVHEGGKLVVSYPPEVIDFDSTNVPAKVVAALELLLDVRPALVVVDAAQGALAAAGLNEDRSPDVLWWHSRYLEPVLLLGGTTVMIDHTGHEEGGRARGASGKGQIARVEVLFEKLEPFDRDRVGKVSTELRKNTRAAPISARQYWRVGGTPFVLEPDAFPPVPDGADPSATDERIVRDVEDLLRSRAGERLSKNQVRGLVVGANAAIDRALVALADSGDSPVRGEPDGRGVRYWYPSESALAYADLAGVGKPIPPAKSGEVGDLAVGEVRRG